MCQALPVIVTEASTIVIVYFTDEEIKAYRHSVFLHKVT